MKYISVIAWLVAVALPGPALAACCVDVKVTIAAKDPRGGPLLKVRLTNNSSQALEVNEGALPWSTRYSLILLAARERAPNEPLKQRFSFDDIGPENVVIQPKQTLEGEIDIREFFENVEAELSTGSLILLWSYKFVATDKQESGRLAGWIRLPPTK